MFCFGYTGGGRGFCQGDLGGALNHNGVQIGIASWSVGCARPNYPGVYTKISNSAIFNHIEYCRSNNYFHSDS
ncbi:hypothetical protein FQR65_LT18460 [Abscondita terminalis]|nr:hypothetical protein FQR65_LT18460 [Abscondita terminalis]